MERIEDILTAGVSTGYPINGRTVWLPALPLPYYSLRRRLCDAWAVFMDRAAAVQWPHQRKAESKEAGE